MPQSYDEKRRILVSWRASRSKVGAPTGKWVMRLKDRIAVQFGDEFDVIDTQAFRGGDRADPRDGSWTDFLSVWTIDYCIICGDECNKSEEDNELCSVLPRIGEPGLAHWVARLEAGDPRTSRVGKLRPWANETCWRFVPNLEPNVSDQKPLPTTDLTLDKGIREHVIPTLTGRRQEIA